MNKSDKDHLEWIYGRLHFRYSVPHNTDWMIMFRKIIDSIVPDDKAWTPEPGDVVEVFGYGEAPSYLDGIYIVGHLMNGGYCVYKHPEHDPSGFATLPHIRPAEPNTTYLLDEYPAKQYFSTRKLKSDDKPCKCGWYHSDGYMCTKYVGDNPQLKDEVKATLDGCLVVVDDTPPYEHYSSYTRTLSDDEVQDIEQKLNEMYKVYDPTGAKKETLDEYPAIGAYSPNKLSSDAPNRVADVATVAKNATVDEKCRGFILKREDGMRFTIGYGADGWIDTKEIERIADGQNVYYVGQQETLEEGE